MASRQEATQTCFSGRGGVTQSSRGGEERNDPLLAKGMRKFRDVVRDLIRGKGGRVSKRFNGGKKNGQVCNEILFWRSEERSVPKKEEKEVDARKPEMKKKLSRKKGIGKGYGGPRRVPLCFGKHDRAGGSGGGKKKKNRRRER